MASVCQFNAAEKLDPSDPDAHRRLARLYQSMVHKEEAMVEFEKTSSLHKAENDSVFSKLKAAQERGKPADAAPGSLANQ